MTAILTTLIFDFLCVLGVRYLFLTFCLALGFQLAACSKETGGSVAVQAQPTGILSVSDGPLFDFGSVIMGESASKEFVVTNIGNHDVTQMTGSFYLSTSFSYVGGSFPGTDGTCGTSLSPGEACSIRVLFEPKFTATLEASIQINYNNGVNFKTTGSPTLRGTGITVP